MTSVVARVAMWVCLAAPALAGAQALQAVGTMRVPVKVLYPVISPAGNQIAAFCADHKVRILSMPAGAVLRTVDPGSGKIGGAAFSQDGTRLGMSYLNGAVRVIDVASGATVRELTPSAIPTATIALSPDGHFLAIGPRELPPQLWDVQRGVKVATLPVPFSGANALAFSPDGKLLASAGSDAIVRVYDARTGKPVSTFEDLLLESFSVSFSPDSKTLVIGGADRVLVAIDPLTGKEQRRLSAQHDPVVAVSTLADGHTVIAYFVSADRMSEGRNTMSWDFRTGQSKVVAAGKSFMSGGAVPDGRLILASPDSNGLKLWAIR